MPTISSKFVVDGEREYKQALSQIADSTKMLNSEMRLVKTQFSENEKSMEALTSKGEVYEKQVANQKQRVETLEKALRDAATRYGETDKRTKAWQTSLNNAKSELIKLENQMEDNNKQIKEFGESTEESGNQMSGLGDMIQSLADKAGISLPNGLTNAANGLGQVNTQAVAVAGGIGVAIAAIVKIETALIDLTKAAAGAADEILTLSTVTGISTDTLQEYAYAAELVDVSVETITDSQTKLIRSMADAQSGTASQIEAFEKLGIAYTNADGTLRDSQAVYWEVIDALGEMTNETERDAAAMDLLGRSARELNPLIEAGSERMEELAKEARESGYVMSSDMLNALGKVDDAMQKLSNTSEAAKNSIAAEFAPFLTDALEDIRDLVQGLGKAATDSGLATTFGSMLSSASSLLSVLGTTAGPVLKMFNELLKPIALTMAVIADAATVLGGILTLDWDMIKTGFGWNMASGQLSAQQKLEHAGAMGTNTYVPGVGWVGNGYNAGGTDNWRGGLTWVGENGPELAMLPRGTQITSASESREFVGDTTIYVTIDAKNVKEFNDIVEIAQNERLKARMEG